MLDTPLTILLLTAATAPERAEYAYRTLHAVLDNLFYDGPLFVHIADDGSTQEHRDVLHGIAGGYAHVRGISTSNSEGKGYGANFNAATQSVHANNGFIMPLEDDWELRVPLDATQMCEALGATIHCIRLGYLGFTQPLRGELVSKAGRIYWLLDPGSPEPHVWAGHPRIETRDFQRRVGEWPVGLNPGATEFEVCHRMEARVGVAWPEGWPGFAHIGAVQARQDQREAVV